MKIIHLFHNFCPQKKCGADPVTAGIMAGGSLLGDVLDVTVGYNQQKDMARYNLDRQAEENQLNRDWQTAEAEKARQFTSAQVLQQNAFQKELQSQQHTYNMQAMDRQAQLNSPVTQAKLLSRAGINPQVYFGNHASFAGSSAQSGGAPAAPSPGSSPTVGSAPGLSPIGFQPTKLAIGTLLKEIAEASGTFGENERAWQRLGAEIRNLTVDSDLKESMNLGQKIMNHVNFKKMPYSIQQAALDLHKTLSEIELNNENKITQESVRKVNESVARFNEAQAGLTDKQAQKLGLEMPYVVKIIKAQINKMGAETREANTAANLNVKQGSLVDQRARNERFWNDLNQSERQSLVDQIQLQARSAKLQNNLTESKMRVIDELTRKLENENDWFVANQILDRIQQVAQDVIDFKSLKVKQDANDISRDRNDIEREDVAGKYGDTFEDTYNTYDSQGRKHTQKRKYNASRQRYKGSK